MIKLYIKDNCPDCKNIEEKLEDMVIAHNKINVNRTDERSGYESYPVIEDDGNIYDTEEKIKQYLEELQKTYEHWNKFQSDACYIDEDGDVC